MDTKDLISKVRHLDIFTSRNVTEVFAGNYKSSFKGQGMEIADVREYADGDDARHIDWIVTARQEKPYIKQYQETRELTTIVMMDLSASMNFTSTGRTKQEAALELAAILLFSALKMNDKFGAILFSEEGEKYIPPKKGKSHLLRIFREIILGFEQNYKKSYPKKALDFLNNIVRAQSICFFVGDEITEEMAPQIKIANKKHDFVYLNVFDPFERKITHSDFLEIEDPETGEQMIIDLSNEKLRKRFEDLRKQKLEAMRSIVRKNQIEMVDVSTEDNVYRELLLFFKRRQARY